MKQSYYETAMSRRSLLAELAALSLSYVGLSAFSRFGAGAALKWNDNFELAVDFDIAQQNGGRSHRPYVAVWIEDAKGNPVRTLILWVENSGRGPRYFHELRRWFSAARDEQQAGGPDLVATVSSATRLPGSYSATWNGRDDRGQVVEQGTYRVFVEAAREHGSYQLMQQELVLGADPKSADLGSNQEIARARVEYRRRK